MERDSHSRKSLEILSVRRKIVAWKRSINYTNYIQRERDEGLLARDEVRL